MCVVSMVSDHYWEKWQQIPYIQNPIGPPPNPSPITSEELEEFRKLLERAREYDRKNNEPDCELTDKQDALKKIAKQLGVEITFL